MMSRSLFDASQPSRQRQVLTVTELNLQLRDALQRRFASVWVGGETSDLAKPRSGHIYLSLKDQEGQLRAVIWRGVASRLPFDLEDGMDVVCEGQIDVYPPRGSYQLIIRQIEPRGIGSLQLALMQLRDRLEAEGLFDPRRKRPLPRFPRRLAVVTSPTGAAIQDFLEVQRRRWRSTRITIVPTRVQGAEAAEEIVSAIRRAIRLSPRPDVLIVTRGGGSLEDLWCFNDERVIRAIANSPVPVVSAIGHEIDVTLSDLAADMRALTPSEAAERTAPSEVDLRATLASCRRLLAQSMRRKLQLARTRVESLAMRPVLAHPAQRLQDLARRLDENEARLNRSMGQCLRDRERQLVSFAGRLDALSPLSVLRRGYSLTQRADDGTLVRSNEQVTIGDSIRTQLAEGVVISRVTDANSAPANE